MEVFTSHQLGGISINVLLQILVVQRNKLIRKGSRGLTADEIDELYNLVYKAAKK